MGANASGKKRIVMILVALNAIVTLGQGILILTDLASGIQYSVQGITWIAFLLTVSGVLELIAVGLLWADKRLGLALATASCVVTLMVHIYGIVVGGGTTYWPLLVNLAVLVYLYI